MRLIDADELYKELEEVRMDYIDEDSMSSKFAADVIETVQDEYLAKSPTVDAAHVQHGKWIDRVDTDTPVHECSVCGARVVKGFYEYDNPNKYCYHCGAKMDLEV